MKTLSLLRHAKSSWDDPALADRDRPLAPRGRRAAKTLARHVRRSRIGAELVLCSPAVRTRETLEPIRRELGDPTVRFPEGLYAAEFETLLDVVHGVEPTVRSTLLIGHNPGLQLLALRLARSGDRDALRRLADKFPTGALATIALDVGSWDEVGRVAGTLVAYVVPRELEGDG